MKSIVSSELFLANLKPFSFLLSLALVSTSSIASDQSDLPIADAHIHYSHDSVELTPPERVIEIMRSANLKFALVSSSDDNGTQLLSELAPDLIVPGLRPYRRRGELQTWFTDPEALAYVESLLKKNAYASIGEFHLYGANAELDIPRRIVELADEYNLILHAHSDADAVERLLAQSDTVKVIWAHSGFDSPEDIGIMLEKHDRLWADLAFRSEVGSGGSLSDAWRDLFEAYPDRLMLGTDTYTPERMYFIPEAAEAARVWLSTLPTELAQNIAWKNAFDLIMPVWQQNSKTYTLQVSDACSANIENAVVLAGERYRALIETDSSLEVSKATSATVTLCGSVESVKSVQLDASMPAHGHGTNYTPSVTLLQANDDYATYKVEGIVLHMPGKWQWDLDVIDKAGSDTLNMSFQLD